MSPNSWRALAALATFFLVSATGPAWAGKTTCLTGTNPEVADDPAEIGSVRSLVDDACPCASYDGSSGQTHGNFVKCASDVIKAQSELGNLRKQCVGAVKKYYAQSTCGQPESAGKVVCVKKTLSNGKVVCSIKPAGACVSNPGKFDAVACTDFDLCIDAADTNGDLRIAAPGDTGECNATAACGNNTIEAGEVCDGTDLGGADCTDFGYSNGAGLGCDPSCDQLDTSACAPTCDGSLLEPGETCDGADLGGETCESQGFSGGTLACDGTCQLDSSGCFEAADLFLEVFSPSALPVGGADVQIGTTTMQTDDEGGVLFAGLTPGRTVARVSAEGFAPSTAVVDLAAGTSATAVVRLLRLGDPIAFTEESGVVATRGAVKVTIPADALVDGEGNPVSGEVEMTIAPLDPTTEEVVFAPGPFEGLPEGSGTPTPFESIFMAEISLSQNGNPVHLAPGQTATLVYTLPASLQGVFSDGEMIAAWFYDLDAGMWVQEGNGVITTINSLQVWVAQVSHFTWWNCDKPYTDKNCLLVTVTREANGLPISGATVRAEGVTYQGTSYGTTGPTGTACVDIKLGSTVSVIAEHPSFPVQVGGPTLFTGDSTPAACSGQGGECSELDIEMGGQTCLTGTVRESDGVTPIEGASVYAVSQGGTTFRSYTTLSAADGTFCVEAPVGLVVNVRTTYFDGTTLFVAETTGGGAGELSCGSPGCATVGTLVVSPATNQSCIKGRIWQQSSSCEAPQPVPGTPVYVYLSTPNVVCPGNPEDWGDLAAQATTDDDGYFCIEYPRTGGGRGAGGSDLTVRLVPGDCITQQTYGNGGGPRTFTEDIFDPFRTCEEDDCIDAGDINMYFGCYSEG